VQLVKDFAFSNNFVVYTLLIMADSGNKSVYFWSFGNFAAVRERSPQL
jgi:hypothetical protein